MLLLFNQKNELHVQLLELSCLLVLFLKMRPIFDAYGGDAALSPIPLIRLQLCSARAVNSVVV